MVAIEAVLLVCELFDALVPAVYAAPYFLWADVGQHERSGVAVGGCILLRDGMSHSKLCRLAFDAWNGPRQECNTRHGE